MATPDLNLLIALDALLSEGSVTRAGHRLRLSPSAMSRTLTRLREATGDPLMVRAGRGLVPTPRAIELRERTARLVQDAESVLRPTESLVLGQLVRTFTLRVSDGFVEQFGGALLTHVRAQAPGVRLRFVQKVDKDAAPLRDGLVDLETGVVVPDTAPELRQQTLFHDRHVGVVRAGHALAKGRVTLARYTAGVHVSVSRKGATNAPIDDALAAHDARREFAAVVGGFAAAIAIARDTDCIATVPGAHTKRLRDGMAQFTLPFATPDLAVAMLWHPRMDADAAHKWLRGCVKAVCTPARSARN